MSTRERVMDTEDKQELKLLRSKVKYLEDRIEVMARSIGSINKILGRFQMTENNGSGFKDLDKFRDSDTMDSDGDDNGNTAIITEEREHELI
jgi:hypothetical protein